jgi:predicted transcriptional regulator
MGFNTVEFDLSFDKSRIGGTGNLTASSYTVEGVNNLDGTPRMLSIGQLVMALCLARATELEAEIIKVVESLNSTSEDLERLTEIEKAIVNQTEGNVDLTTSKLSDGTTYKAFLESKGITVSGNTANSSSEQLISDIEAKMDSLNSFSQQTMIDLQSLTAKRDQSYDMISNIIKSLNTVLVGTANNM